METEFEASRVSVPVEAGTLQPAFVPLLRERMIQAAYTFRPDVNVDQFLLRFTDSPTLEESWGRLEGTLKWRRDQRVDTLPDWFGNSAQGQEIANYWPDGLLGEDEDGRPVLLEHLALLDPVDALARFSAETVLLYHIWRMEKTLPMMHHQAGMVVLANLEGLAWKHLVYARQGVDYYRPVLHMYGSHYPNMLSRFYVLNPPWIGWAIFKLVQPFFSSYTRQKVIMTSASDQTISHLVPTVWGGQRDPIDGTRLIPPSKSAHGSESE